MHLVRIFSTFNVNGGTADAANADAAMQTPPLSSRPCTVERPLERIHSSAYTSKVHARAMCDKTLVLPYSRGRVSRSCTSKNERTVQLVPRLFVYKYVGEYLLQMRTGQSPAVRRFVRVVAVWCLVHTRTHVHVLLTTITGISTMTNPRASALTRPPPSRPPPRRAFPSRHQAALRFKLRRNPVNSSSLPTRRYFSSKYRT